MYLRALFIFCVIPDADTPRAKQTFVEPKTRTSHERTGNGGLEQISIFGPIFELRIRSV